MQPSANGCSTNCSTYNKQRLGKCDDQNSVGWRCCETITYLQRIYSFLYQKINKVCIFTNNLNQAYILGEQQEFIAVLRIINISGMSKFTRAIKYCTIGFLVWFLTQHEFNIFIVCTNKLNYTEGLFLTSSSNIENKQ